MLIVDTSKSMEVNDPRGGRAQAAADLISSFSPEADVEFGIISFDDYGTALTDGFTRNPTDLSNALSGLTRQDGFTNYLDALNRAQVMINDDLAAIAEEIALAEEAGEDSQHLRPWYFILFLSDGIPRVRGGQIQSETQILFMVDQLVHVPEPALGATLHTAFVGTQDDAQRAQAETLLKQMAATGQGIFFSFENGDEIDFSLFDFQIRRRFDIKQFVAYNRSAVLENGYVMPDSDGDGVADIKEIELGTDPLLRDTDGDGFGDGFELIAGTNPKVVNFFCDSDPTLDTDNDGLSDCEETFLNFDSERFDTDGDLFPDWLELFSGTNPADASDVFEDLDFDGMISGDEVRQRTDPTVADQDKVSYYGYHYQVVHVQEIGSAGQFVSNCYEFEIENVTLVDVLDPAGEAAGVNEIFLEFIESPEDTPEEIFTLRRLRIPISYFDDAGLRHKVLDVSAQVEEFSTIATQRISKD